MGHTDFDSNCEEHVNCEPGYSLHGMALSENMGIRGDLVHMKMYRRSRLSWMTVSVLVFQDGKRLIPVPNTEDTSRKDFHTE